MALLKQLRIPCLELQAAILASCLVKTIVKECMIQFADVNSSLTAVLYLPGFKVLPAVQAVCLNTDWGNLE